MTIFWFRRDLRLQDNAGLLRALSSDKSVQPIFIFDKGILDRLDDKKDRRVSFIYSAVRQLKEDLIAQGSDLLVFHDHPINVFYELISKGMTSIYVNRDYEPLAIERDRQIYDLCEQHGISFIAQKDQVIFDRHEITKPDGSPYTVYTPYSKQWKKKLAECPQAPLDLSPYLPHLKQVTPTPLFSLSYIGFEWSDTFSATPSINEKVIENYHNHRDFPGMNGTTQLSVHLRFGTISIRQLVTIAQQKSEKWLNELIWRDFYHMILYHFPHTPNDEFKAKYRLVEWENNPDHFEAWCNGQTGYPIVDAGMRELNETGFMHNRVRMIVASFLTKHLLIDWRWGERYFASKLIDYDLASNVGGWQWAAGSGCDAAPYFRVFNPYLQTERFDPDLTYVKRWVPEYDDPAYPTPIVEHKFARQRAITRYKDAFS
jgi:deoxyribodipyrimidine photo-lyase